jgi:DNA polymerase-3 subunit epsilon
MIPRKIAFVDTETTGTDHDLHEIIELAVLVTDLQLRPIEPAFTVRITPEYIERAEPKALECNGYKPEGWDGTTHELAFAAAAPLMENAMLAGHNVQFDIRFLQASFKRANIPFPKVDYRHLDTMSLAFPLLAEGRTTALNLSAICDELGIPRPEPHHALDDVLASLEVARRMMEERTWKGTIRRLWRRLFRWWRKSQKK